MIGNETKVLRFLLFAFLLLSVLFACKDIFGPLDNPADRESENYQGYDTILNKDNIELFFPPVNSSLAGIPTKFIVSEVINASAYQIQISSSQSDFVNNILFDKSDYASNKIDIELQSLSRGIWYYWRARAQQSGEWGKWTEISSFIIAGSFLFATGGNYDGQLGDGTTVDKSTPVEVMEDVQSVSAGEYHTMIVKNDGSLWATGDNSYGQLGDGTTVDKSTPVEVMEDVQSVSAGWNHTMILKNDGSLWATGMNGDGELGDGTTVDKSTPVKVMEDVQSVSAGMWHTMILKNCGNLWATGWNCYGQLGDGTYYWKSTPVKVMEDVQSVSAGEYHTMIMVLSF